MGYEGIRRVAAVVVVALFATLAPLVVLDLPAQAAVQSGFRGPSYVGFGAESQGGAITGQKPESKLWHQDDIWYASMVSASSAGAHTIHRLTGTTWTDTGVVTEPRPSAKEDILNTGSKLYVVSRADSGSGGAQLRRFSHASGVYTLDPGFPVAVPGAGAETLTIDRDTTGTLWLTYAEGSVIRYAHTTSSDTAWSPPLSLPFSEATSVSADDISGVVAFSDATGPAIGIMFSNQNDDAQYFAVHRDGAAPSTWTLETALSGPAESDDHINLKAGDGRVFAAVKTSASASAQPLIRLLERSSTGSWTKHPVAKVSEQNTRPIAMLELDLVTREIYVFMGIGQGNAGRGISYKRTSIDGIGFPEQATVLIEGTAGEAISHPTSSKSNATSTSGIVVLASDGVNYWHGRLLNGVAGNPPTAMSAATGTTAGDSLPIRLDAGDPEDCELSFTVTSGPSDGSLGPITDEACIAGSPNSDSASLVYTPNPGFSGSDQFTFTVDDGLYTSESASVDIVVTTDGIFLRGSSFSQNDVDNVVSVPLPAGIQANDVMLASVDVRGAPTITAPSGWSLVRLDANGSTQRKATYVKVASAAETSPVTFGLSSTQSAVAGVLVYAGVEASNPIDAHAGTINGSANPNLVAPSITTSVDDTKIVALFGAAADATIDPPVGMTERGEAVANSGQYDVVGEAADRDQAAAGATGSATATANTSVRSVSQQIALRPGVVVPNQPPTANDDTANVDPGGSVNIDVAGNDTDPDGTINPASIVITAPASQGTTTVNPDGTVDYTANPTASGTDTFIYTIEDDDADVSNPATVTINIVPNQPPTANDDTANVDPGGSVNIDVAGNDTDPDGTINPASIVITAPASQGTTTVNPDGTVDYTANPTASGTDTFIYTIEDDDADVSNPATVTINIVPNQPPTANDDTANVDPGGSVNIDVAGNDTDPDGTINPASIVITAPASQGTTTVNPDGTVDYTANPTASGTDTFIYTIEDDDADVSNPATVTINIVPNQPPTANDDTANVDPGGSVNIDVAGNDTDPDGTINPASIVITVPASQGTTTVNPDGTVDYTANPTASGTDTFIYTIEDDDADVSNPATVTINIVPNQPPTANDDTANVDPGGSVNIDVAGNDTDPDGTINPASIVITAPASQGTTTVNPDGTVDYTANPTASGTDTFIYTIEDDDADVSNPATVTINIVPNQPPTANDDTANVDPGGSVNIDVAGNDTDPDGTINPASIVITAPASQGTTTVNPDGTVDYTANPTASGTDTFIYTIEDDDADVSNPATVTINIVEPPTEITLRSSSEAANQTASTLVIPAPAGVQPGDVLIATVDSRGKPTITAPAGWTLIRFDANANTQRKATFFKVATGSEPASYTFTLSRTESASGAILAYIGVDTTNPIDAHAVSISSTLSPSLVAPSVVTSLDGSMIVTLTGAARNVDIEPAPTTTEWVEITSIGNYDITTHAAGKLQATAGPTGSFTAVASGSTKYISQTIALRPGVVVPNQPPTANDDTANVDPGGSVNIDVAGNDTDPDGTINPASIVITVPASQGTTTVNPDGTVDYTANPTASGTDTFIYTIEDDDADVSNPATVTINIVPNQPPTANDDTANVDPGGSVNIDVAGNDTDPDGTINPASIVITVPASQGTTTVNPDGTVDYTANPTASGTDTFIYTIEDDDADVSNPATVTINIVPNQPPTANDDTANVDPGGSVNIDVAGNDTDPDGTINPASIVITVPASQGTTTVNPDGTVDYTANPTASGTDTFIYTIEDDDADVSNPATVTINIVPNQPPTANDDTANVDPGGSVNIDVAGNDTDPDGTINPASIVITVPASQGTTTVNPDGTVDYTANPTASGTDTFIYTIEDDDADVSNPATVTINIVPNQPPTANDDTANVDPGGSVNIDVAGNDTDPDGTINPASIVITVPASQGTTTVNPDGTVDYTANPTASGTDTFIYTIEDDDADVSNPATVTINIVEPPTEITLRSSSEAANQTASTLVIPAPAGVQPGDVLIATVDSRGKPTITAPAGWTLIRFDANANTQRKATFYRVATGSEPASYTFTLSRTESASGAILAYIGVDTTNPIDVHDVNIEQGNRTDQLVAPSVVASTDGSMIVTLTGAARNVDIEPAPTTTEWVEITSIGNYDITTHAAGKLQATAGPTGSFTAVASGSTKYISQTIALRPGT